MKIKSTPLESVKESVIRKILDDKVHNKEIVSDEQYEVEYKELLKKVSNKEVVTVPLKQTHLSDAKAFNEVMQNLYIDILTVFGSMNEMSQSINRHKKINESIVSNLKTQISKANDQLSNIENTIKERWSSDNYIEAFRDIESFEERQLFFTERNGQPMAQAYTVSFDKFNESVILPYTTKTNILLHTNGISFANITTLKQLGSGLTRIVNERNSIDKAIDTSMDTYWAESIICDTPMQVELDDYYYNIKHGAVCELEINLETASIINEISFTPFGAYPMEIVAIRYTETDDADDEVKEIVSPNKAEKLLKSRVINDSTSFMFPDILCKRIRILVNQIHYVKSDFIYSTEDVSKNELWFNATGKVKPIIDKNAFFKPVYEDKALKDKAWVLLNNSIRTIKEFNIKTLIYGKKDTKKPVSKYQYTYGFYNIGVYFNDFQDTGIYVSKPVSAKGNIKSIGLEVDEIMQDDICDIEYSMSYVDNPKEQDWIPILPSGKSRVTNELLLRDASHNTYTLRFPAAEIENVYLNQRPLAEGVEYAPITDLHGEITGVSLLIPPRPNVKATVSYVPAEGSDTIELLDNDRVTPMRSSAVIISDNSNWYELPNTPFLSPGNSTNIKVITPAGAILTENDGDIHCVTNPYNTGTSYRNFVDNDSIQYYIHKNIVYFNKRIPKSYTIQVEYHHLVSKVRLKAIMRRNGFNSNWLTPVLDSYKIKFNTID